VGKVFTRLASRLVGKRPELFGVPELPAVQKSFMYGLIYFFYSQHAQWSLAADDIEMHGLPA
ncbi:hypothetical protein A262_16415, partial [Pseudomonas syringae pv. actinidiae ICMP 19073]